MDAFGPDLIKIAEIIWINIILSGDNAVVIALACRGLPAGQRRTGMALGAGVAVLMRIVFTLIVVSLLATPFLKMAGGLLLLWVAVKLITDEGDEEENVKPSDRLWKAVRTIAIADAVMSLDNVLAIAGVAGDSYFLLILGLAISIPLIVAGAGLIMTILDRFPILVWAGAGLLGWVAGEMFLTDPWLAGRLGPDLVHQLERPAASVGAVVVLALGAVLRRFQARPAG